MQDLSAEDRVNRSAPSVVVAGTGLVTPVGRSAWESFSSLLAGRTMTDRSSNLPPEAEPAAVVKTLGGAAQAQHASADPAIELGDRAAREAIYEAGVDPARTPTLLASSKGAVGALLKARISASGSPRAVDPDLAAVVALGPHAYLAAQLRKRLRVPSVEPVVAACASGLAAVRRAEAILRRTDGPESVLVVASEAALWPLFIESYRRLGVLPPATRDGYRAAPLDASRAGFLLNESAAAVVLSRRAARAGDTELVGAADAAEAYDLIQPAPGMPAVERVGRALLQGEPVDLLHPHAPGTEAHDPAELAALARAGGGRDAYAIKGAIGHGLGAAGLAALVCACLCGRTRRRPPMPWLRAPIESEPPLSAGPAALPESPRQAVLAAGFGGHVAGAMIRTHGPSPAGQ